MMPPGSPYDPIFHGVAGCNKVTKFSRFIVHVQPDLKADTVSQAFNETLNSCFCRMRPRAQAEPDTQAEHDFKNMYIKVGGKNCVSEEAMETKLRSSGIEPLKVEGIMYKGSDEWTVRTFVGRRHGISSSPICG